MLWISSINELDYYNTVPGSICYCSALVFPSDLVLQAQVNNISNDLVLNIETLSPDGLTVYEDSVDYFSYYSFVIGNIQYFNIRLNSYSPAMCSNKCWILHVTISGDGQTQFDKYTQRYCQASCCDVARNIVFTDAGITPDVPTGPQRLSTLNSVPTTECGSPLIRIETTFDCFDNQLGDYYGIPAGQTWGFVKITNIQGKVRVKPREITRNISYNCNLQRSESFIPYSVRSLGEGTFPAWKLKELESMFHASVINVSDFEYDYTFQFDGGTIGKPIGESVCWDLFQLDATLRTCAIRQTFGCNEVCESVASQLTFLVPEDYAGGNFYTENRMAVGDFENLLDWYRAQSGVTSVEDVTADYDNIFAAFTVQGTAYIPTQFYYDSPTPRNRVFGVSEPVSPVIVCARPTIGAIQLTNQVCAAVTVGTVILTTQTEVEYEVFSHGNWSVTSDKITASNDRWYKMQFNSTNETLAETSPLIYLSGEIVGQVSPEAIPLQPQAFQLTDDILVTIDTYGVVRYSGYPTSYTDEYIRVTLTDIYYYGG